MKKCLLQYFQLASEVSFKSSLCAFAKRTYEKQDFSCLPCLLDYEKQDFSCLPSLLDYEKQDFSCLPSLLD